MKLREYDCDSHGSGPFSIVDYAGLFDFYRCGDLRVGPGDSVSPPGHQGFGDLYPLKRK
ncbi:hypothetical protein MJA45_02515 [Paenibacillus aurantius]|uniref:Uncharacterized protein n=1 Tax=Paenibacillus aurantius TaxID=2918900 RepID=A0AA96RFF9_9BACL|nr:hypothetical protein [Paenibacillus aurantius]WNQ11952.1 hypothetical protein MJA45_02515 [Paenibacillus aurantius]